MQRAPIRRIVTVALLLQAGRLCFAYGPPFITDDPQPVDFKHWEVYIASIDQRFFGVTSGTLPHLEVNYGVVPNVQLHVITPMAYAQTSGQPFQYGLGDTELGVKVRLLDETPTRPMVGIFPLYEAPTGNQLQGLGTGSPSTFLPVWLQKTYGAWTLYGGGGFWHVPTAHDYWFGGITAQCQTRKNLMLGFELFHTTSQTPGSGDVSGFNFGAVYDFDDGHHLMFSAGTGFQGADRGTAYLAYQWTFGPHEKPEKGAASAMLFRGR